MPVETNKYLADYRIIESPCRTKGCEEWVVYGLRAEFAGETAEVFAVGDISAKKDDIGRLIILLNEYGVAKDHLIDVIEDFVQELFM